MATVIQIVPAGNATESLRRSAQLCTVAGEGQRVNGRKERSLARRRFQKGQLVQPQRHDEAGRIDKDCSVWLGRWREDVVREGRVRRVRRTCVLGTFRELPTAKLAERVLRKHIDRAAVQHDPFSDDSPKSAAQDSSALRSRKRDASSALQRALLHVLPARVRDRNACWRALRSACR